MKVNTTSYRGKLKKTARVETNDPEQAKFQIALSVEVVPIWEMKPFNRLIVSTPVGQPAAQSITLTNKLTQPVEIVGLRHELGDRAELKLTPLEKGRSYELTLSTAAQQETRYGGKVLLELKGAPIKATDLKIFVHVWSPQKKERPIVIQPSSPPAKGH